MWRREYVLGISRRLVKRAKDIKGIGMTSDGSAANGLDMTA